MSIPSSPLQISNENEDTYIAEYSSGCLLYIVYSAIEIPPEKIPILDAIILASRAGLLAHDPTQTGQTKTVYGALYIIDPYEKSSVIQRGSRVPMQPFDHYAFAGDSLQNIYSWFRDWTDRLIAANPGENISFPTSHHHFAVIDERTLRDETLLLCSDSIMRDENEEGVIKYGIEGDETPVPAQLTTMRADAYSSLMCLTCAEVDRPPLIRYESMNRKNRQFVYTKEYDEHEMTEYRAQVQAKAARGESLQMSRNY